MGRSLTDYTNLFSSNNNMFESNSIECSFIECNSIKCNSIESIELNSIDTSNLNNEQFRLNKISQIEDSFIAEIKERELMSKKLSKYISFFDYFDKSLIVLSVTIGGVSIASFATIIVIPVGINCVRDL